MAQVGEMKLDGLIPLDGKRFYDIIQQAKQRQAGDNRTPGERRRDQLNTEKDWMDPEEYNCKLCSNRGFTAEVNIKNGYEYVLTPECRCMDIRRAIWRMKRSGLYGVIKKYTLERFECQQDWQRVMVETARRYIAEGLDGGRWFFAGGQPGSGKTHICTAIARDALYRFPVCYMMWEEESKKLKAVVNEAEEYQSAIAQFKSVEVLYIDDLFKPSYDDFGKQRKPTAADIKLAFEIINYRYVNAKPTIISSEWYMDALADIDEATASRIAERCGDFQIVIGKDRAKNYRFRGKA